MLFLVLLMPFLCILKEIPYTHFDYKVPSKALYVIYYYQKFSFVVSCLIMVSICKSKLEVECIYAGRIDALLFIFERFLVHKIS